MLLWHPQHQHHLTQKDKSIPWKVCISTNLYPIQSLKPHPSISAHEKDGLVTSRTSSCTRSKILERPIRLQLFVVTMHSAILFGQKLERENPCNSLFNWSGLTDHDYHLCKFFCWIKISPSTSCQLYMFVLQKKLTMHACTEKVFINTAISTIKFSVIKFSPTKAGGKIGKNFSWQNMVAINVTCYEKRDYIHTILQYKSQYLLSMTMTYLLSTNTQPVSIYIQQQIYTHSTLYYSIPSYKDEQKSQN